MASFDYADMAQTALEIIEEYGVEAAIARHDSGGSTPWNPVAGGSTEYPCTVIVTYYVDSLLNGSSIKQGDKKIIVAAADLPITPTTTDTITVNGEKYSVVNVKNVAPGGVSLIYEIQARL